MTLDEFLESSSTCTTAKDLSALYARAIAQLGYQNATIERLGLDGLVDLPDHQTPDHAVGICTKSNREPVDPVLARTMLTDKQFNLDNVRAARELPRDQQRTASPGNDIGAPSGMATPSHVPERVMELIGASQCDDNQLDRQATGKIVAFASIMRWRSWQIENASPIEHHECSKEHAGGPPGMMDAHCRALVLVRLAERRREMGLAQLSAKIHALIAEHDLEQLMNWGYVVEVPDDSSFTFNLATSPIGARHVDTCEMAKVFRRQAWITSVPRNERPIAGF